MSIFESVVEYFTDTDWPYTRLEDLPILRIPFKGENGQWMCTAVVKEDLDQFAFYSTLVVNTPEEKRLTMAEFLTRANYGLIIGNWEMDFNDGEVRYKTSLDVEGTEIDASLIKQIVHANVVITDQYFPGIMKIVYSDITAEEAIAMVEA